MASDIEMDAALLAAIEALKEAIAIRQERDVLRAAMERVHAIVLGVEIELKEAKGGETVDNPGQLS